MTVTQAIEKLQSLDLERALIEAIDATEEQYEDLNRKQWSEGKMSDGSQIGAGYSPAYAKKRKKAGLQTEYVDLKFTGDFYGGYTLQQDFPKMRLGSNVSYDSGLTKRYSDKIWGLTDENMRTYRNIIKPVIIGFLKEQLYGQRMLGV